MAIKSLQSKYRWMHNDLPHSSPDKHWYTRKVKVYLVIFLGSPFAKRALSVSSMFFWICDMVRIYLVPFAFPGLLPSYMSKNHEIPIRFWPKAMFPYFNQTSIVGMPCTRSIVLKFITDDTSEREGFNITWTRKGIGWVGASRSSSHGFFCALKMGCFGGSKWCREEATNSWFGSFECEEFYFISSTRETVEILYTVTNRIVMDRCSTTVNSW